MRKSLSLDHDDIFLNLIPTLLFLEYRAVSSLQQGSLMDFVKGGRWRVEGRVSRKNNCMLWSAPGKLQSQNIEFPGPSTTAIFLYKIV